MLSALFARFVTRPDLNSQNTGRQVYMRPLGPFSVDVNGLGGHANFRSLSPFNVSADSDQFITLADLRGTGNGFNTDPLQFPLNDKPPTSQF